jgi:hypothetical protein
MESRRIGDLDILIEKGGSREYTKVSYPVMYGCYSEIVSPEIVCRFGLNGELRFLQGRGRDWTHPAEWLKRSVGGDWVYYSAGEYREIFDLFGEYYVPRLPYRSNCIFRNDPFEDPLVKHALNAWESLTARLKHFLPGIPPGPLRDFLETVSEKGPAELARRAEEFHALLGGPVTVLPPDTRHVDYDVIPVVVADGCLYHCAFCSVKSAQSFLPRGPDDIRAQLEGLRAFYGRDLSNTNSVFLAHHDALAAGEERIEFAAARAYETLEIGSSYMKGPRLFLFGSADSLLDAGEDLFRTIRALPFYTHINVGLESADPETLFGLGKPLSVRQVEEAFERMLEVNRMYRNIEVSANFLCGVKLPAGHLPSLVSLTRDRPDRFLDKGAVYLSPMLDEDPLRAEDKGSLLRDFRELKRQSRLPLYLYLIQRL